MPSTSTGTHPPAPSPTTCGAWAARSVEGAEAMLKSRAIPPWRRMPGRRSSRPRRPSRPPAKQPSHVPISHHGTASPGRGTLTRPRSSVDPGLAESVSCLTACKTPGRIDTRSHRPPVQRLPRHWTQLDKVLAGPDGTRARCLLVDLPDHDRSPWTSHGATTGDRRLPGHRCIAYDGPVVWRVEGDVSYVMNEDTAQMRELSSRAGRSSSTGRATGCTARRPRS